MLKFHASQDLTMNVPNQAVPIEHYLRQPQRLVQAVTDRTQVEQLSPSEFRLKLRPLNFMMFSFQPTVDLQVWAQADGTINLRSLACEIHGVEYLKKSFQFNLTGNLSPESRGTATLLKGRADLTVQVELPPALFLTPKSILETAGNTFLHGILLTMKHRLERQLARDYQAWAKSMQVSADTSTMIPITNPVT
ncbi:DUF1997 domain-containing protein [Chlorogloeopsis fritschii PCC 9212]|uniref:DUF1997 domain-containing protein n=1 Tax=Chlorogloeopsis fritschii PCC 6912 TaxID=211165 RepID=A0A3S0XZ03_CHLFR|nr:DUF1997 domain-containing protein [Chlorogloeopsis fritschii]RUR84216.1 hypothetical protein PCC6912_18100 [Chlorogloeopsis fritschii PCC 6912]